MEASILENAKIWLGSAYDEPTRKAVQNLIDNDETELNEAFYRNLEFGTGGLRGIMGVGTNRMNVYTVAMATQGFADYIKKSYPDNSPLSVAIACDSRHQSDVFSEISARVFAANDFKVYLFVGMRPTPELSFAVRYFHCNAGVMITASHNPKEYNGYKAYWSDGGQLTAPHDVNVIKEVEKIRDFSEVKILGTIGEDMETAMRCKAGAIEWIGMEVDDAYLAKVKSLSLAPQAIKKQKDLKMVYTPLHGTGSTLVPRVLRELGFENLSIVADQAVPDGAFPTVKSPNPEEKAALQMAIDQAKYIGADLVMATDPDADRVGIAVKSKSGEYILLNGNQTASVLIYYLLNKWEEAGRLSGKEYIVKTIVTTELLKDMAERKGVKCYDVLTGFKYIAEVLKEKEGKEIFIGGGEESYGYLVSDFVRDKDAVIACCMIAEMAADAACQNKSFIDILEDLYKEYGFYKEGLLSLTKKGKSGIEEIQKMMSAYRANPPKEINGIKVRTIYDYKTREIVDLKTGSKTVIELPKSDVLQFFTEEGDKITIRPSGTEPKIKFYFGVKAPWIMGASYEEQNLALETKIEAIIHSMGLRS